MSIDRSLEYLRSLLKELISLPQETEWVEFKSNNDNPELIGEYISALANAAALYGKKVLMPFGVSTMKPMLLLVRTFRLVAHATNNRS